MNFDEMDIEPNSEPSAGRKSSPKALEISSKVSDIEINYVFVSNFFLVSFIFNWSSRKVGTYMIFFLSSDLCIVKLCGITVAQLSLYFFSFKWYR